MSGSAVDFAGSVGTDGAWLKEFLKERGVGTDLMIVHGGQPSGRAIIQTTPDGENAIFLFPGTNHISYPNDRPALQPYHTHLLLQNEIRLSDTVDTLHAAHRQGVLSIFNPSPMLLPEELRSFPWGELSVLVVNEGEASTLLDALGERTKLPAFGGTAILDALASLPALSGISGIVVFWGWFVHVIIEVIRKEATYTLRDRLPMAYVRGYHQAAPHIGGSHTQTYPPPVNHYPPAYYQQQPPPFPDNIRDPIAFHHMFNEQLATLTFNSKAIIQHLGYISKMYANSPMAPIIAESIERHIAKVPAAIKLPPFYLLDSIAKNIGHPYISYFTNFIVRLFLDTYHLVDAPTRGKMEEMLVTWRTAQYGRELFGQGPQVAIERGVWGSGAADSAAGSSKNRPNINQVLLELDVTLSSKERLLAANPNDQETASHIE
ncbi:hypothetical protein FRC12_015480, partial [Ceratobasidium sp. 428]